LKKRIFHCALTGASFSGLAGLIEAACVLRGYSYEVDYGLLLRILPTHLLFGAAIGLLAALVLPFLSRRKDRLAQPWLHHAILVGVGITTAATLLIAHTNWLPLAAGPLSTPGLLLSSQVIAGGAVLYFTLYAFAHSKYGWRVATLCSPLVQATLLACVVFVAGAATLIPIQPAAFTPQAENSAPDNSPNVILVVLDTVAASHLGAYGYYRPTSPALDSFAAESVLFEQSYSAAPWTLPSHASLFTGLHATTHHTGWAHPRLEGAGTDWKENPALNYHTLAEELSLRGYQTTGFSDKSWLTADSGVLQGFAHYKDFSILSPTQSMLLPGFLGRFFGPPFGDATPSDKGGQRVVQATLDWLDTHRVDAQPFFAFLNLNEAHDPYIPPAELRTRFLPEGITAEDSAALPQGPIIRKNLLCGLRHEDPQESEILRALYDAEVLYQDGLLDQLFSGLRDREVMENTLVIVTADHGEEFGEQNQRYGHQGTLADRLLHVPLIMRYPSMLPAGKRVQTLASGVDVFPTVTDLIQKVTGETWQPHPASLALEGFSLLPAILEARPTRNMVLAHYGHLAAYYQGFPSFAQGDIMDFPFLDWMHSATMIRTIDEKVVVYGDGHSSFIELAHDPNEDAGEVKIAPSVFPIRGHELGFQMNQFLNEYAKRRNLLLSPFSSRSKAKANAQSKQALEQLGYTGDDTASGDQEKQADGLQVHPFVR